MFINALLYTRCMPNVRTKYPSSNQNASASSSVPGTSAATRSTTSRQNSFGISASNSSCDIEFSARDGIDPPAPGSGNHSRCTCRFASTIAASKRMMGNSRATCRMV